MSLTLFDSSRTLDRFFDDFFGAAENGRSVARAEGAWRPAADVASDTQSYTFQFDVPGVAKDDIDIRVEDGVLEVSGERKSVEEGSRNGFYKRETLRGRFRRSFRLPKDADASEVTASYADGVLTVRVAKLEAAQPRRIPIDNVSEATA